MKLYSRVITFAVVLLTSGLIYALANDNSVLMHTVKKGESISLICIDYYGYYSKDLGAAILKDNPSIKNINIIVAGQKIRFPKPVEAAGAIPKPPSDSPDSKSANSGALGRDTLFVKKVNATQGVVTCIVGTVRYKSTGQKEFKNLKVNTTVYPGDIIETGSDGRAEIIINRESVVRLKEKTRMELESFRDNASDNGKTRLGFNAGTIWTKMKRFKDKIARFELELPTAVAGVHGTVYQTSVNTDKSAEVKVFTGEVAVSGLPQQAGPNDAAGLTEVAGPTEVQGPVEVSMETWTQIVTSMQKLSINKNGAPASPEAFEKNPESDWEKWNMERDLRIAEIFAEQ